MAITYEAIATSTLTTTASSITFSSIPQTYTDLVLVSHMVPSSTTYYRFYLNGVTTASYGEVFIYGVPGGVGPSTNQSSFLPGQSCTVGNPFSSKLEIFSYAGNKFKSTLHTSAALSVAGGAMVLAAQIFTDTTPITSISIDGGSTASNLFAADSKVTLYGIKAA